MLLRLLAMIGSGLGLGALVGVVGAALLVLIFRRMLLESTPEEHRASVQWWIGMAPAVLAIAALLTYLATSGRVGNIRLLQFLREPALLLAVVNILVYSITIAPHLTQIRAEVAKQYPNYMVAVNRAIVAHYVSLCLSGGLLTSGTLLASDLLREQKLTAPAILLVISAVTGIVRLVSSIASSYSDLAAVSLYADGGLKGTDMREFDESLQRLFNRPLSTWTVPILVSAFSILLRSSMDGFIGIAEILDTLQSHNV